MVGRKYSVYPILSVNIFKRLNKEIKQIISIFFLPLDSVSPAIFCFSLNKALLPGTLSMAPASIEAG